MLKLFVAIQMLFTKLKDERGATAVEYGLLVSLIAGVMIAIVVILGGQIRDAFTGVSNQFTPAKP
jgi:pilus assembly protein Flp/PilA